MKDIIFFLFSDFVFLKINDKMMTNFIVCATVCYGQNAGFLF